MKAHGFARVPWTLFDDGTWASLTGSEQAVLMVLLRYASLAMGRCYPGRKAIAKMAGVSFSAVSGITAKLEKRGLVKKEHRHDEQGQARVIYQLSGSAWVDQKSGLPSSRSLNHRVDQKSDQEGEIDVQVDIQRRHALAAHAATA